MLKEIKIFQLEKNQSSTVKYQKKMTHQIAFKELANLRHSSVKYTKTTLKNDIYKKALALLLTT